MMLTSMISIESNSIEVDFRPVGQGAMSDH